MNDNQILVVYRGEWGKLSHPPEEKMIMSSIVWSYSKDLLHHAVLKIHLVVGKVSSKEKVILSSF